MQIATQMATLVLCLGIIIIVAIMTKEVLSRLKLPSLVGYIIIGIALSSVDSRFDLLNSETENIIHFLAKLGVIILLFHIGLESKLQKLLKQIRQATFIGIGDVTISAIIGFTAAYLILGLSFSISLVIAAALVATSVGISAGIWEENKAIDTDQGQLLLDIAEFDDVLGIIIMALLFSIISVISIKNNTTSLTPKILKTLAPFAVKFFIFGSGCVLFARYIEKPITRFFKNLEKPPEESLTVIAMGLIIAALAGLLGFSVAIGAFFAGLIFSRDPASIKEKTAVNIVYDLFVPFFFIGIGFQTQITTINSAIIPAFVLIIAAFSGKFIVISTSALLFCDRKNSILLGLSMIPRAEIAMIIMQHSLNFQDISMPKHIYSAMVIVCISTCIIPPLILNRLIGKTIRPS